MTTTVTIETREVGQSFGCEGLVRSQKSRRVLARTRVFPFGFDAQAAASAERIASERGYRIDDAE